MSFRPRDVNERSVIVVRLTLTIALLYSCQVRSEANNVLGSQNSRHQTKLCHQKIFIHTNWRQKEKQKSLVKKKKMTMERKTIRYPKAIAKGEEEINSRIPNEMPRIQFPWSEKNDHLRNSSSKVNNNPTNCRKVCPSLNTWLPDDNIGSRFAHWRIGSRLPPAGGHKNWNMTTPSLCSVS